jgi:hypothetical protein
VACFAALGSAGVPAGSSHSDQFYPPTGRQRSQEVEFGICHTHHTRANQIRLQPIATSFVVSIHVRFCSQTRPGACVVFLPRRIGFVCLQKNNLVGPPPFIRSNAVEVPHPNATTQFQYPLALKHPVCRPEISGNILKIRRNSQAPVRRQIKTAVVLFPAC